MSVPGGDSKGDTDQKTEDPTETGEAGAAEVGNPVDVRVAVIGNVDSGKSTMIGVLTSGIFDDGRGSARARIVRHNHEAATGRTSCASMHILGFDADSKRIHQNAPASAKPAQKTVAWTKVYQSSKNLITFIDLAGHEKYLKTTISGLTGSYPDYALIVVAANNGVSMMTREHVQVACALKIPVFMVVTKIDICPENVLRVTKKQITKLVRATSKKLPVQIRKRKEVKKVFQQDPYLNRITPVFYVSAVEGTNLEVLFKFLGGLQPRSSWKVADAVDKPLTGFGSSSDEEGASTVSGELEIDDTFAVKGVGIVLSGVIISGKIVPGQQLVMGPFHDQSFRQIIIKSVHKHRVVAEQGVAGESVSVAFRFVKKRDVVERAAIRKGMVACSADCQPTPVWGFTAKIHVLHHPTTIKVGYQPVVHCGNVRQTASIIEIKDKEYMRAGDVAEVKLRFIARAEYIHAGRPMIVREGFTKMIGTILNVEPDMEPPEDKK